MIGSRRISLDQLLVGGSTDAVAPIAAVWHRCPARQRSRRALTLPDDENLELEPIEARVPVYHGNARIQRDISLGPSYREDSIAVDEVLTYQTCDDEICFPPADFELTFQFDVIQNDRQRAPEEIRHPE